jgi:hypothetical protein
MAFDTLFFPVELAVKYGQEEAVILNSIIYWIKKNKENNRHFYDGRTWTYNSGTAFGKQFPFWSRRQIERIMKSLISQKAVITGQYNENPYDHTLWYALENETQFIGQYDSTKRGNRMNETVEPTLHQMGESTLPQTGESNKLNKKPKITKKGSLSLPVYISLCKKRDKGESLTASEKQYLANFEEAAINEAGLPPENNDKLADIKHEPEFIETNPLMLEVHKTLQKKLSDGEYNNWFKNKMLFINDDRKELTLGFPTRFIKEFVGTTFMTKIVESTIQHFGERSAISLIVIPKK